MKTSKTKIIQTNDYCSQEKAKQSRIIWRAKMRTQIADIISSANEVLMIHNKLVDLNPNGGRLSLPLANFAKNVINTMEDIAVEEYNPISSYGQRFQYPWDKGFENILEQQHSFIRGLVYVEEQIIRDNEEKKENNA